MSLQAARVDRDRLRSLLRGGANPAQVARVEKAAHGERSANTFSAIGLELPAKCTREGLSPGLVVRERRLVEKDLAGLGNLPVGDITAPTLLAALRKLEQRGAVEAAHRARAQAGRIFRYAIATGRADINPAQDLTMALEQPQTKHFASVTDPAVIGDLLRALWGY